MSVVIAMDGNYPDVSSGTISFENRRTGAKTIMELPKDVVNFVYGIRSITMDPGASATILPESFGKRLGIEKPKGDEEEYHVFSGVGGTNVCFHSPDPIIIGIGNGTEQLKRVILPFFLTMYAPSITSEARLLAQPEYHPYTEKTTRFISPPFRYVDDYTVKVRSPDDLFPPLNRRLKLEVDDNLRYTVLISEGVS